MFLESRSTDGLDDTDRDRGDAMKLNDVMTRDVVAVAPETPLKRVAATLASRRIFGVPVVERGRVIGVVSESDIVAREAVDAHRGVLGRLRRRGDRKSGARLAREAMTAPAITAGSEQDVAEAARLMEDRRINRLPVLGPTGNLMGIVSRADLVRAFARTDEEIARELLEDVLVETLWLDPADIEVTVEQGEVSLEGEVHTKADAKLAARYASRVPGVVAVHSNLHWRIEEAKLPSSDPRVPIAPRR
jgi:CBS domain-containing protein